MRKPTLSRNHALVEEQEQGPRRGVNGRRHANNGDRDNDICYGCRRCCSKYLYKCPTNNLLGGWTTWAVQSAGATGKGERTYKEGCQRL